jgi:membrane fusion protein, copper/silver efflux system
MSLIHKLLQRDGIAWSILVPLSLIVIFSSCASDSTKDHVDDHAMELAYTCPMHPAVIKEKPGTCPICGMDLVPVNRNEAQKSFVMLSDNQMKLANISVRKVSRKVFGQSITVNGTLSLNQEESEFISSRVSGRIEKLAFKETGKHVVKGTYLYSIYSEQLLTLQQEYLLAREQYEKLGAAEKRYKSFLESATKKLLLYGMTVDQLRKIKGKETLNPLVTFVSPSSGVIAELNVTEGQYVAEGTPLFRIENLERLWVEAELYPDETPDINIGDKIEVFTNESNSDVVNATVTFLSPELRASSQLIMMRAEIDNANGNLRPGQQVDISITHSSKETLAVPADALVRSAEGSHVYVMNGKNTFRPVMVKTGLENEREVEIIDGIMEGDTIAISGAYLLYSELVLKKGTNPMAGHRH